MAGKGKYEEPERGKYEDPPKKGKTQEPDAPKKGKYEERNDLPPEILEIMIPALKVGAFTGTFGTFVGAFAGVARSSTPKLFALASGVQWFTLGTTFSATRGFVLDAWGADTLTEKNRVSASAISGGAAGAAGGLLRGPKNIIPGTIVFSIFGALGQTLYNKADARRSASVEASPDGKKSSWIDSKWSPVRRISEAEYEKMLQEKLLRVNAEIALVDDKIEEIRAEERKLAAKKKDTIHTEEKPKEGGAP